MGMEESQTQGSKFPRIGGSNGRIDSNKIGLKGDDNTYPEDDDDGEIKGLRRRGNALNICPSGGLGVNRLCSWPPSRIVRVSRASGGKDRHSKVLTSKGLRDRRVRLSVNTAIQFYDLQDRLGYDQPSKAVEWLLKAAASAIDELPPINSSFPDTPKQLSDKKRSSTRGTEQGLDSAEVELHGGGGYQQHNVSAKSTCSSTSETSKGSGGLSLSRSETRIKARERARKKVAEKEKDKDNDSQLAHHHNPHNVSVIAQNSSFTELLTAGMGSVTAASSPSGSGHQKPGGVEAGNPFQKSTSRQWGTTPMDYLATGLLGPSPSSSRSQQPSSSGFHSQILLGNSFPQSMTFSPLFHSAAGDHHQEMQQYAFMTDHLVSVVAASAAGGNGAADYNLNFTISPTPSLAGFNNSNNRGTLQSNSPSLLPHLPRFSPIDGSGVFLGTAAAVTAAPNNSDAAAPMENHHHVFPHGFESHLQLCYGDGGGGRPSDQKGKGKH